MWLEDRTVQARIRQTRRTPTRFQGYIEVVGPSGRCVIPVGPWHSSKSQALTDAKLAKRLHQQRHIKQED
jgi:hypothetical protein